ncbi:MAG: 5-oxoprolinase, partial [Hyphomicrobiales bacterium]|nr:5-oxoprolinase [Hyphomicrobiales bacterium]
CFGGAGGQHACAIARELGISKIFIHRFAGILSAYGMGLADVVVEQQEPAATIYQRENWPLIEERLEILSSKAKQKLMKQGYETDQIKLQLYLNLRYHGTDTAMMVLQPEDKDYEKDFRAMYLREFGFDLVDRDILVDDIRVRALAKSPRLKKISIPAYQKPPQPIKSTQCYFDGGWQTTNIY